MDASGISTQRCPSNPWKLGAFTWDPQTGFDIHEFRSLEFRGKGEKELFQKKYREGNEGNEGQLLGKVKLGYLEDREIQCLSIPKQDPFKNTWKIQQYDISERS